MINRKPDSKFIEDITHEVKNLQFLHLIVLIVQEKSNGQVSASTLRLQSFPEPHFKRIRNVFAIQRIFTVPLTFTERY